MQQAGTLRNRHPKGAANSAGGQFAVTRLPEPPDCSLSLSLDDDSTSRDAQMHLPGLDIQLERVNGVWEDPTMFSDPTLSRLYGKVPRCDWIEPERIDDVAVSVLAEILNEDPPLTAQQAANTTFFRDVYAGALMAVSQPNDEGQPTYFGNRPSYMLSTSPPYPGYFPAKHMDASLFWRAARKAAQKAAWHLSDAHQYKEDGGWSLDVYQLAYGCYLDATEDIRKESHGPSKECRSARTTLMAGCWSYGETTTTLCSACRELDRIIGGVARPALRRHMSAAEEKAAEVNNEPSPSVLSIVSKVEAVKLISDWVDACRLGRTTQTISPSRIPYEAHALLWAARHIRKFDPETF